MPDLREAVIPHIPRLRRYARALTRDQERADDLVQDALERAIRNGHRYRDGTNLRSWMFTILHNVFVDQVRWNASRPTAALSDGMVATLGQGPSQEHALQLNQLSGEIDRLPPAQRAVVLLVGLEGMSYEEAAVITGTAVGTVKSRLSRARESLRRTGEVETGISPDNGGETESFDGGVERIRGRSAPAGETAGRASRLGRQSGAFSDRPDLQGADAGAAQTL